MAHHGPAHPPHIELPHSQENSHVETLAALVLAIAAVATAWSAYQSTRWGGEMAAKYNEASTSRAESVRRDTLAGQSTIIDVTLASDWASAQNAGQQQLADDLRARMTPQLTRAMNEWLLNWAPGQPLPPGSPFTDESYAAPGREDAALLENRAQALSQAGTRAIHHSDNYVLTGVLFALSLFFAGICGRIGGENNAKLLVYAATALMAVGIVVLLLQPKSIGF